MNITYIKGEDIDKVKWNSCVHYAANGNVFGYKWFLDAVAREWDALVEGDYESVFPLPLQHRRWRKPRIIQPGLMRELGLYSTHVLSLKRMEAFLEAIPKDLSVDLTLNEQNPPLSDTGFRFSEYTNYQLALSDPYEEIAEHYDRDLLLRLEEAVRAELVPVSGLKPERLADFFQKETRYFRGKNQDFHALQRIMYNTLHRGWGFATGVQDRNENLLAANFFVYSHSKVLSLLPLESSEGKKAGALPFLFDTLIRSHAGRPMLLDFNRTEEEAFPRLFGATANVYFGVKR